MTNYDKLFIKFINHSITIRYIHVMYGMYGFQNLRDEGLSYRNIGQSIKNSISWQTPSKEINARVHLAR